MISALTRTPGLRLLHQEHALAGGLGVEQTIGLFGLVELPAAGEQLLDIDLALDDKARAVGLPLPREGPGADDRQLLAQHVGADVDRHIVAFADKAHRTPDLGAAHRRYATLGLARGVEGEIGTAVGQVLDGTHRVVRTWVDRFPGPEFLRASQPLGTHIERNDARTHRGGELRRRQADRALAKQRDRVVAGNLQPAQGAIGGPGAAGDRRSGREGQLVGQRHQGEGRHVQIARVPAMGVVAVYQDRLFLAQLRPARAAVVAHRAALVVVHHDALTVAGHLVADPGADRRDDAARLVPGDDRIGVDRQPADRRAARFGPAVLVQIAAAHARGLHLDDDLAGTRRR